MNNGAPSYSEKYITTEPISNTRSTFSISQRRTLKSSLIISECAVLVGYHSGKYFIDKKIVGITRSFGSRKKIALTLDVDVPYLQQTSPIRRFIDLLNQMQLFLFLTNEKLFTTKQLEGFCDRIESATTKSQELQDHIDMYWMLCYLWEHHNSQSNSMLHGQVGCIGTSTTIALDEEKFCSCKINCDNLHQILDGIYCVEGTSINFVIQSIDWEILTVSIEIIEH